MVFGQEAIEEELLIGNTRIENVTEFVYRRILQIRWQQKITNVDIRRRLEIERNIVQTIMDRKLQLFGHICRMDDNRLVTVSMSGMMNQQARTARQGIYLFI